MRQLSELLRRSSPQETATDLYCITMLFLFPLFPGFSGYMNITLSKLVFFLAATGLWLAALALILLRAKQPLPRPGAAQWAAVVFLAVCVLSALCSPFFPETLSGAGRYDGLLTTAACCLIFLGVSMLTRPKAIHFRAFAAAAALCCGIAAAQLLGCNPLGLFPADLRYQDGGIRYTGAYLGTIGNTNLLDAVLCLIIPLCVCAILRARRWGYLLPLALASVVVIAAGGSGAHLALAAFFLAALLCLPVRRKMRRVCAVMAAVLVLAALAALWFWPGENGTLYELSQLLHGHAEDSYGSSRIRIWRGCLALFPERPLLGGGPGTLALRLDIAFSRYVPETGATLKSYVDNAHNVYLGYLINDGILGLLAYLALLLLCARSALRSARQNELALFCALAVFCGAVQAFFGLGLCLTEPIFFLLLGLCCPAAQPPSIKEVPPCI